MSGVNRVKQHFEDEAQEFDRIIVALIPDYAQMVEALVAALPFNSGASIKVIDLGCGTGTLTLGILRRFPNARVTCLDLAQNMITMARTRLGRKLSYIRR
jgi:tRNA (cmo5U34)-methyltransferase